MSTFSLIPMVANGNIKPSRFVKPDPTATNRALQCGAGDAPLGISQKGERSTPYPGLQDGLCAKQGESFEYFGQAQSAPLALGGTVTAGDFLKPDADGLGITATSGDYYGARTAVSATAQKIIEVQVMFGRVP